MDKIILNNCLFHVNIGCTEEERSKKQLVYIDITLHTNISKSATTDSLEDTIDYCTVHDVILSVTKKAYCLIETMAEKVAEALLKNFPIENVTVKITKPGALKMRNVDSVVIEIIRRRNSPQEF
jgi:7,8-dihydroneopterin aldolase/epimerase/oxygenase